MSSSTHLPTILVVFGATGDLMHRKIIPALFHLHSEKKLPNLFHVIGIARRQLSDGEFHVQIKKSVQAHVKDGVDDDVLNAFAKRFHYVSGTFEEVYTYQNIAKLVGKTETGWEACANKLFYLAVPPPHYSLIFNNLAESGLTKECGGDEGWTRVIVEKPFGQDTKTAQDLDNLLGTLFKEEQIYRIDHYLAKEMTQNIMAFRFANTLFEDIWQAPHVKQIDIKLHESLDVNGRAGYYDGIGALRDMGQNHLLQVMALTTMDHPGMFTDRAIRKKRLEILQSLRVPTRDYIKEHTFRGQYEGYRQADKVAPDSQTETYFKVRAELNHPRWAGVPIYIESGKALGAKCKEITVHLRHPNPCMCPADTGAHFHNKVVLRMEPERGILIDFLAKKPGITMEVEPRQFEFKFAHENNVDDFVEEYVRLLHDCIRGDQTLFVSTEEVSAMWKFVDPILAGWQENLVPLETYRANNNDIVKQATAVVSVVSSQLPKEIGYIGLGKMGSNMVRRLLAHGWKVIGYNRSSDAIDALVAEGMEPAYTLEELMQKTGKNGPRLLWIMVPHFAVDDVIWGPKSLLQWLKAGDYVIDGGNSNFNDSKRRYEKLEDVHINYMDVGVSGGPGGALNGACMMVGGRQDRYEYTLPLFRDACTERGHMFFPGPGAGHFVKMVHNGIEYGMMQAIAEGFSLMKDADYDLNLTNVARIYEHGSVIESALVTWLRQAFEQFGENLDPISGKVSHSGEGKWTVDYAHSQGKHYEIIHDAFQYRLDSESKPEFLGQVLMAMRNQFGGHSIDPKK